MSEPLFDRLGGRDGVRRAVNDLYGRLLDDPAVSHYFDDIDLPKLNLHMTDFLTAALTGARSGYSGRPLDVAHHGLGIDDKAFDGVVTHLRGALDDAGLDGATVGEVVVLLEPLRPLVVQG